MDGVGEVWGGDVCQVCGICCGRGFSSKGVDELAVLLESLDFPSLDVPQAVLGTAQHSLGSGRARSLGSLPSAVADKGVGAVWELFEEQLCVQWLERCLL